MTSRTQSIDSWLATHAAHQPNKTALRYEGQAWSYTELNTWVRRLATGLASEYGIARGDRIACLGHNSASQLALFFAAARLGAIVVPLNWRLAADELQYILDDVTPRLLVVGPACAPLAQDLRVEPTCREEELPQSGETTGGGQLADPLLIVYTSGTTGRPKGAVHTQEAVFWNAVISQHAHDFTAHDHVLNILPLFHLGGINIQVMPALFVGATVTLHSGFDPRKTLAALGSDGITTTVCVPTVMRALMSLPEWPVTVFPAFRLMNTGSTDVPVDILRDVNARGIPMVQVYGATETGPIATYQRAEEAASSLGSIGRPAAHCEVQIRNDEGRICDLGRPGEIWVRGPNNFARYWQNTEATKAALVDGWFKTGDIGRVDADGLIWFVGRTKHVIISGGENIYPAEIERILSVIPGVREVVVVGRPDPKWGEVPVVVASVVDGGPDHARLLAACDGPIARFKRPKDIVFVDELPKNALGKVVIEEARQMAVRSNAACN